MNLIRGISSSDSQPCHYLPDRTWRFEYFFASELNGDELNELLAKGWRKFGTYYFRPSCAGCSECIPIRVLAGDFRPSKNQRDVIKKNRSVEVIFGPLNYSEDIYRIYREHSGKRFGNYPDLDDFLFSFYTQSCPALQSEYYLDGKLIGAGFLDRTPNALSSVYFVFDTDYSRLSLGTFSAITEIQYAASLGMKYYYLGYYIDSCGRMSYKKRFRPYEVYDWTGETWHV
jgi:leucyl-tRNA---protein transferase